MQSRMSALHTELGQAVGEVRQRDGENAKLTAGYEVRLARVRSEENTQETKMLDEELDCTNDRTVHSFGSFSKLFLSHYGLTT